MPDNVSDKILDGVTIHTVSLLRVAAAERAKVLKALTRLEAEIVADLQTIAGAGINATRLRALLVQTRRTIAGAYKAIKTEQGAQMAKLAALEARKTVEVINAAIRAPIVTVGMTATQLKAIAGDTLVGAKYPAEHWDDHEASLRDRFATEMRLGMLRGESVDEMMRRVRGTRAAAYTDGMMLASKRQAEALVRTSVIATANEARLETYADNEDIVKAVQWVATLDSRTTQICRALDGLQWSVPDYDPIGHNKKWPGPTAHWNCFPGDVRISSPHGASKLYRRAYSGELLTVETFGGRTEAATPNHPVLTTRGWRPIGQLKVGDNLVCECRDVRGSGRPQDERFNATFAELAKATAEFLGVRSVKVPISAPDFHGDGTDEEIGEVWSYCGLRGERNAAIAKLIGKRQFNPGNFYVAEALAGLRGLFQRFAAWCAPALCGMGGLRIGKFTAVPPGAQIGGTIASYPAGLTPAQQRCQTDSELLRNVARRLGVACVEADGVRMIRRGEAVSVFVHNIETPKGWYFANGVASHNCRSTQISVLKSWEELSGVKIGRQTGIEDAMAAKLERLGMKPEQIEKAIEGTRASMDGQVAKALDFNEWLKGKGAAFQDKLLGPTRAALFRSGAATMADMTDQNNRPLTIAQLEESL